MGLFNAAAQRTQQGMEVPPPPPPPPNPPILASNQTNAAQAAGRAAAAASGGVAGTVRTSPQGDTGSTNAAKVMLGGER